MNKKRFFFIVTYTQQTILNKILINYLTIF